VLDRSRGKAVENDIHQLAESARALSRSDPRRSLEVAELAAELAMTVATPRSHALAHRARGVAFWAMGRWNDALEALSDAETRALEGGDPLLAAQSQLLGIEALAQLSRYGKAVELAERLEIQLRQLGADDDAAKAVANAGNIHFQREAFAAALSCWERALAHFQEGGAAGPVASLQVNIGNVLTQMHRLPEARAFYARARVAMVSAGAEQVVAGIDANLGFLEYVAGDATAALRLFGEARERFSRLGVPRDVARCERDMADVYLELNLLPEAAETYRRVLPLFRELGMAAETARTELGLAASLAADTAPQAQAEAAACLDSASATYLDERNRVGQARVQLQRAEAVLRALQAVERATPIEQAATAAAAAGQALRAFRAEGLSVPGIRARLVRAELRLEAGVTSGAALRRCVNDAADLPSLRWRAEAALADLAVRLGSRRGAARRFRRAIGAVERARLVLRGEEFRRAFFLDKERLYDRFVAFLLDWGTPTALREAFQVAERARSRTLIDRLSEGLLGSVTQAARTDPTRRALAERVQALRTELQWDYARIDPGGDGLSSRFPSPDPALRERVRARERELLESERAFQLRDESSPEGLPSDGVTLSQLQQCLGPDEQLLEYATVGDEVLVFLVEARRFRVFRGLASRQVVVRTLDRMHRQWSRCRAGVPSGPLGARLNESARLLLCDLHQQLLEPVAEFLVASRLTIVPHGALHGVPFAGLHGGSGYAVDRWELTVSPSAGVYRSCRSASDPGSTAALIVGPDDPGLSHAREEVETLRKRLPGARYLEGPDAALEQLPVTGQFRCMHFATHAEFRADNPLFSGLRLADGWLLALDLGRRRLECALAVLSACRTGVSGGPGSEMLGLVRGFLSAGARAVLVSLWDADDHATAELMDAFYREWLAGSGRAAALRTAQRELRERFPHPYHWAAFTLAGAH
jgi:tetratricopeptide (TPR) repeat protein